MLVTIGQIRGLYGVRGWVKVFSYTSPITNILNYSPWQIDRQGQRQTILVREGKAHGKGIIASLESFHDRDDVACLIGANIAIHREQLPSPADGEYYWADLIGLTVINCESICLGQVEHLIETGAHDVLVVRGERERLIPFVLEHIVCSVDLEQRVLLVDWDADF